MNTPPQGFTQYPRPQMSPSGVRPLPPGVHIEAIGEAFTLFQKQWGTWVLATLVSGLCFLAVYMPGGLFVFMTGAGKSGELGLGQFGAVVAWFIVIFSVQIMFQFGLVSMALKQLRGQQLKVSDVFGAARYLPRLLGATFCMGLLAGAGFIFCIIPGLWAYGAFGLTPYIILDQDRGVFESLDKSYKAAGNFMVGLSMFGMLLLIGLLTGVGSIVCYVGLLVTVPIGVLAGTVEYYYFFPEAFGTQLQPNYG